VTLQLLEDITELAVSGRLSELESQLDESIKDSLTEAARLPAPGDVDFTTLDLGSGSDWDKFIRSLSPDIPTFLSDLISVNHRTVSRLDYLWCRVSEDLTEERQERLLEWYRKAFFALSGRRLDLKSLRLTQ
jgi:hypothetical protein